MNHVLLFLARVSPTLWLGAATLFVIVGVREVTSEAFNSTVRDQLVAIRFPAYYIAGGLLQILTLAGIALVDLPDELPRSRRLIVLFTSIGLLVLLAIDFCWVYLPLLNEISPPGMTRSDTFYFLHRLSTLLNGMNWLGTAFIMVLMNWPFDRPSGELRGVVNPPTLVTPGSGRIRPGSASGRSQAGGSSGKVRASGASQTRHIPLGGD